LKITNCYVERTFNLGNYESLKIGFEAVLSETDNPLEVTADLEMLCHQHIQNQKNKPGTATTPTAKQNEPTQIAPPQQKTAITQPGIVKQIPAPVWEPMNPTTLGPWDRSKDLQNPALQEIINQLDQHKGYYSDDLYKYWLLKDQRDETKITGVGRRAK
jgi:hypothetical protein